VLLPLPKHSLYVWKKGKELGIFLPNKYVFVTKESNEQQNGVEYSQNFISFSL